MSLKASTSWPVSSSVVRFAFWVKSLVARTRSMVAARPRSGATIDRCRREAMRMPTSIAAAALMTAESIASRSRARSSEASARMSRRPTTRPPLTMSAERRSERIAEQPPERGRGIAPDRHCRARRPSRPRRNRLPSARLIWAKRISGTRRMAFSDRIAVARSPLSTASETVAAKTSAVAWSSARLASENRDNSR